MYHKENKEILAYSEDFPVAHMIEGIDPVIIERVVISKKGLRGRVHSSESSYSSDHSYEF